MGLSNSQAHRRTKAGIIECEIINSVDMEKVYEAVDRGETEIPMYFAETQRPLTPSGCIAALELGGKVEGNRVWFPINLGWDPDTGQNKKVFLVFYTAPIVEESLTFDEYWNITGAS